MTSDSLRAAGYVRVSTARQAEEGLSLDEQGRRVREYIARQGWELAEVYVERGVSGRQDDRPELGRLFANLDRIDRLVVPKLDRLGRSNRHLFKTFDRLEAADVGLVSLADNLDTSTASGRLTRSITAALAEFEADLIAERVSGVSGARAAEGKHHGRAPYGYAARDGSLSIVEPQATVVRRIFEQAERGISQRGIARRLNHDRVASHTGKKWQQPAIRRVLTNVTYRGAVEVNGEVYPGAHAAVVSPERWEAVARLRESQARTKGGGRGRPTRGTHLFTGGLLRCGHCDGAMVPRTNRDNRTGNSYEVYMCNGRLQNGPGFCPMTRVPRRPVDEAAFEYFEAAGLDLDAMRDQLRHAAQSKAAEVAELLQGAERDERAAAEALARVRRDYTSGNLTAAEWRELKGDLEADHEASRAKLAQLSVRAEEVKSAAAQVEDTNGEAVRRLAAVKAAVSGQVRGADDLGAVRAALLRLFDSFTIIRAPKGEADPLPSEVREIVGAQHESIDRALAADGTQLLAVGEWVIAPWARREVVAGIDESWRPVLRRSSLSLASNNDHEGLTT